MQIAVTTIDIFHNIVLFVKEMCVCGASPDRAQSNRPVGEMTGFRREGEEQDIIGECGARGVTVENNCPLLKM